MFNNLLIIVWLILSYKSKTTKDIEPSVWLKVILWPALNFQQQILNLCLKWNEVCFRKPFLSRVKSCRLLRRWVRFLSNNQSIRNNDNDPTTTFLWRRVQCITEHKIEFLKTYFHSAILFENQYVKMLIKKQSIMFFLY
jgi:hypothetical protein